MQLYEGLPIITNKITHEEQHGIPHHLLGRIGLNEQTWTVGLFVKKALEHIHEIRSRGRLPILVGGTHYYTQSLLFHDRLAEEDKNETHLHDTTKEWPVLAGSTETILEELRKVDPIMADRWHPNDRRKIQRSLEIWLKTGKRASDVYREQRERGKQSDEVIAANGESVENNAIIPIGPLMRFPTLLLWVHAQDEQLRARLDRRVDKMLAQGLLHEVQTLNEQADQQAAVGTPADETRGIWVSIGYKEFKTYQQALQAASMDAKELERLKEEAVEKTKIATRQYAKRQLRWLRIKLINALSSAVVSDHCFMFDGSNVEAFGKDVVEPAGDLTQRFLMGAQLPDPKSTSSMAEAMLTPKQAFDLSAAPEKWARQVCDVCNMTAVTERDWQQHVKSRSHRTAISKKKQRDSGVDARTLHECAAKEKG